MTVNPTMVKSHEQAEQTERRIRQAHLMRLREELRQEGVQVRVRKPHNGRWKLAFQVPCGGQVTVLCAGAEGAYAYVTGYGRLLGSVADVRYVAQTVAWLADGRHR